MIATEQNSEKQLQRLGAQRQLYSTAKIILGWQLFFSGAIATLSAILVVLDPALKGFAAAFGILLTFADIFWMTPWQKRLRHRAAKIQEAFDCDVLEMPWNEVKAGKRPDPELIKEQSDNYAKRAARMTPIANWYAPVVSDLPIHIGRIACQRSNCWWDAKQRRHYAISVIAMVLVIFVGVTGFSLETGFTLEGFVIKVIVPLMPTFVLGIRQYREQMEAAERVDRLKDHAERLWTDALSSKAKARLAMVSRSLQDEILENREKSPLVFDFIFKRLRPRYEVQMNFGVEELVAEAKKKLKLA